MKGILIRPEVWQAKLKVLEHGEAQTRRLIKQQPQWQEPNHELEWRGRIITPESLIDFARYQVGEVVYVKEKALYWDGGAAGISAVVYADDPEIPELLKDNNRLLVARETTNILAGEPVVGKWMWKSALFMYAEDARYFIKIIGVRAERLQEITEEDALAEGITIMQGTHQSIRKNLTTGKLEPLGKPESYTARYHYEALWNSINPKYPWEMNPWVFAYSFIDMHVNYKTRGVRRLNG